MVNVKKTTVRRTEGKVEDRKNSLKNLGGNEKKKGRIERNEGRN